MVREDFQGMGVASYLIVELEKIARKNGYKGFSAMVLPENRSMIRVFKKRYPNARTATTEGGEISILMDFEA